MKKQKLFLFLIIFFIGFRVFSQDFKIPPPRLDFDGKKLLVSYDVISSKHSDKFYVWMEIQKKNGEVLKVNSISGDVGDTKAGKNKLVTWVPENDSVFLNEMVEVELKAEKYEKSFNKGSMTLLSIAVPGLGQTKISNGKPYWLTGVAAYGALAGGLILRSNYLETYDEYLIEEDPKKRSELYDQTQKQMNLSSALFVTSAAIWTANLIWIGLTPNRYLPLKHAIITLEPSYLPASGTNILTMTVFLKYP
jgi:hypothetical protein